MSNWFKRFFGIDNNEQEESSDTRADYPKGHLYNGKNADTKMVYDYPKGKFRFPVIPDEENGDDVVRKQTPTIQKNVRMFEKDAVNVQARTERKRPVQRRNDRPLHSDIKEPVTKKRPFKPTEVPSPVYGFHERPTKKQTVLLDFAEAEQEIAINSTMNSIEYSENKQQVKEATPSVDQQLEKSQNKETANMEMQQNENSPSFEPIVNQKQVMVTIAHEKSQYDGNSQAVYDQQECDQEKKETAVQHESTLSQKNVEPFFNGNQFKQKEEKVPFNVLMYSQDKPVSDRPQLQPFEKASANQNKRIWPPLHLLNVPKAETNDDDQEWLEEQSILLDLAFESFNVGAKVVRSKKGPAVTQFEVQPEHGVRVSKITNLTDDLKLALAAKDIRIEAPIPGKSTVGIEVPNRNTRPVVIREILHSPVFQKHSSPLAVALGLDISGQPIVTDLKKMPHGLIAGATGSGKSVCINSIIVSLLYKAAPHEVKLLLIDPKMVELAPYNDLPHLVSPVITDVKAATAALKWAVDEMERRYEVFAHEGVRDINRFNEKVQSQNNKAETMPYLVIIIDELADLMMVSPQDVEEAICRIAQKARACGIHLLLATQRPSVDVITGLIKANVPTRIAFAVSSQVDSRTIIDMSGAEKLLGKGDMLFLENGSNKPIRVQGNFVSDDEIERVTNFLREQMEPNYLFVQEELLKNTTEIGGDDELFMEACEFVIDQQAASASSLQRRFRIGYNRAARLIDMMEAQGIISEAKGSKPRDVLLTKEQLERLQHDGV